MSIWNLRHFGESKFFAPFGGHLKSQGHLGDFPRSFERDIWCVWVCEGFWWSKKLKERPDLIPAPGATEAQGVSSFSCDNATAVAAEMKD